MLSQVNKNSVREELNKNKIQAKKKFGQNFLSDENILNNIIKSADLDKDTAVIEVGPGLGALTKKLCKAAGFVLAYEIDSDLIPVLKTNLVEYTNYEVINQDILTVDINDAISTKLSNYEKIYLVANLPYYITTPIILGLLSQTKLIRRYVMMMQLEVAQRICGVPKTKDYNALSIVIGYQAKASKEFNVPRTVFIPEPNVDSAVVRLDLFDEPKYSIMDEKYFLELIRLSFIQRRKTLVNNLGTQMEKPFIYQMLRDLGIKDGVRAEELAISDFVNISNYITQNK